MPNEINNILSVNQQRIDAINATFNPITGEGSIGERFEFVVADYPIQRQWLPMAMKSIPLIKKLAKVGSIEKFITSTLKVDYDKESRAKVISQLVRLRMRYDFAFWAASFVWIKRKGGGDDVLFRLTRPQRKFVTRLEELR